MRTIAIQSLLTCGLLILAGCGETAPETPARATFPTPERVMVAPFAALTRSGRPVEGQADLKQTGAAQASLQQALVAQLRFAGLPAEAGTADAAHGNTMLVQGQMIRVDNGTARRGSAYGADVQLLYVAGNAAPQFLEAFEIEPRGTAPDVDGLAQDAGKRIRATAAAQGWLAKR